MKRSAVVLVVAMLVGLLSAASGAAPAGARPAIPAEAAAPALGPVTLSAWRDCGGLECATLTVPMDHDNPGDGRTVRLAVSRLAATQAPYAGVLVLNPGGPGASGLGLPLRRDDLPGTAARRYDWIGFDPRGVGASRPALHCNPRYFGTNRPSFVPRTAALRRYWTARTAGYARDCGRSAAAASGLLGFMSTRDTARDVESLRAALQAAAPIGRRPQVEKLNYFGFSYGTYLGAVYASTYPARVGRFILDGVVDPTRYWYGSNLRQQVAFDQNLNRFFAWVARHPRAYRLGSKPAQVRAGYYALLRKLDRRPAAGGQLGPNELGDALLGVAYDVGDWAGTAEAYSLLVRKGRGYPLLARYAGANQGASAENLYAVYLAVQCTDQRSPGMKTLIADATRLHRSHPYATWNNTWYNMPCRTWPVPARGKVRVNGSALAAQGAKVLLINETYDAATPFSGALALRDLFPTASLIEGVGGTTHSGSLRNVSCVESRIVRFLADAEDVPPRLGGRRADLRCPAVPRPPAR